MSPQSNWPHRGKVTMAALVEFFARVIFEMYPQNMCILGRKITLVAFEWFFSGMSLQMLPQTAWVNCRKNTLVAFIGNLSFLPNNWFFRTFWNRRRRIHCSNKFGTVKIQCFLSFGIILVSYPTRWSLLFIFGFLYVSSKQQRNIVQLCTNQTGDQPRKRGGKEVC